MVTGMRTNRLSRIWLPVVGVIAAIGFFAACAEETPIEGFISSTDYLSVPPSVNLSGDQTMATFDISSNSSWSVSGAPEWFSVTPTSGSGDATITIKAQANNSSLESRSATLAVSTPDGLKFDVVVTQSKANEQLSLDVSELKFTQEGGQQSIAVHNNSKWTVTGMTDWLVLDRTSGEGNMDISLTVYANPTEQVRSTVLTVQGSKASATVSVTQDPKVTTLTLTPLTVTIDAGQHDVPVTLEGDATWTASSSAEWATPDQLTGTGGTTVRINCAMNTATSARTATISFKTSRTTLTCEITQLGGSAPQLTKPVVSDVTKSTAVVAGSYTSPFDVTDYGFCWSETANPTIDDTKVGFSGGSTSGSFNTTLSGLESAKEYHVRSYAVNSYGIQYSEEVTFTTGGTKPDSGDVTPPVL